MRIEDMADAEPFLRALPEVEHDVPADCAECARLFHQARAAVLTGDRSRLSDVRVYPATAAGLRFADYALGRTDTVRPMYPRLFPRGHGQVSLNTW